MSCTFPRPNCIISPFHITMLTETHITTLSAMSPNKAIARRLVFVLLCNEVGVTSPYISTRVVPPFSWAGVATEGVGIKAILSVWWMSLTQTLFGIASAPEKTRPEGVSNRPW